MIATLVLYGHCPSKKNLWKRGKGGRTYIDDETQALIDTLTAQAKTQWKHEPVTHPWMSFQFFTQDRRRDRDNLLTTVLDCNVKLHNPAITSEDVERIYEQLIPASGLLWCLEADWRMFKDTAHV